ncbi:sterol desaturase family protein [Halobacteriovorax sp. HLS]|uniref:sterol desaturase family protein n=1 Tax=Halobacteriovorax sp. HLS TaxID=2234000 RepID=UPI000FD838FF|nr:sterol desaturase family protein [Halobacteriovorax sp. HLS]
MKKYESIRIFKNPILEACTHVHPVVPLLLWLPVAVYCAIVGFNSNNLSMGQAVLWFGIGLIVWTLTEYLLHRFMFHFPAKNKWTKQFVFLFHGLHHDDPNDPTRLVMPPVPAVLIMALLYYGFGLVVPAQFLLVFMSAFIIGYLCYDYIHYATHHFPMKGAISRYLKKFHLQHHFRHEKAKYGVSSPLWDIIFRTMEGPKEDGH